MKIGLTGSIGTGKSTVSNIFLSKGIKVIDADKIAKEIMEDEKCIDKIKEAFGNKIVDSNGKIYRKLLRELIFSEKKYRELLEKITHPLINEKIDDEYEKLKCEKVVIFDIPLLFEVNKNSEMDKVIVVACDENIQLRRIAKRDNIELKDAKLIINTQIPQQKKISRADYVIYNNGTILELKKAVEDILSKI